MKVRIGFAMGGQRMLGIERYGEVLDDLERLRFDSVWLPETFLGGTFDPIVALSYAAAHVPRLKLGSHLVAPGRNPITLAKSLAQLDRLSAGRLLLVFVPGLADPEERAVQGMPDGDRTLWFDEHLPAMRRLWAGEEVDGARLESLPMQQPLEVWLGGKAAKAMERIGRIGDGWLAGLITLPEAIAGRDIIDRSAADAGRAVSGEHFGVNLSYTLGPELPSVTPISRRAAGDPRDLISVGAAALRDNVRRWCDAGFSKIVVRPLAPPTDWHAELEALADAVVDLQT